MNYRKTRIQIFLIWLVSSLTISFIGSVLSILYWNFTYQPEAGVDWKPINDMLGMITLLPIGILLSILTPWSWINIVGLGVAIYLKNLKPLLLSVVGACGFGYVWPKWFVAMMGI